MNTNFRKTLLIIVGLLVAQLAIRWVISGNNDLFILWWINLLICLWVYVFFVKEKNLKQWVIPNTGTNNRIREFLVSYWFALTLWLLSVSFISLLLWKWSIGMFMLLLIILLGISHIIDRVPLKEWINRWKSRLWISAIALFLWILVTVLILLYQWSLSPLYLYPWALWFWFLIYSLLLEIDRAENKEVRRSNIPIWIVFFSLFVVSLIRSLWSYALTRIDDHTIEKIVYEEKIVYVPIGEEETDGTCDDKSCVTTTWECVQKPQNASCILDTEQWRECSEWREQDWNICVEIIEVILEEPEVSLIEPIVEYNSAPRVPSYTTLIEEDSSIDEKVDEEISPSLSAQLYLKLRGVIWNNNIDESLDIPTDNTLELSPIQKAIKKNNPQSVEDLLWNN